MATSTLHLAPQPPVDHGTPTPPNGSGLTAVGLDRGWTSSPWLLRGSLIALLAGTGALYLWGLSANGYANSLYSAAVQAGSESWKACSTARWTRRTPSPWTSLPPRSG